ncbi:hypothetical protein ES703_71991 [subsurface metagenome]
MVILPVSGFLTMVFQRSWDKFVLGISGKFSRSPDTSPLIPLTAGTSAVRSSSIEGVLNELGLPFVMSTLTGSPLSTLRLTTPSTRSCRSNRIEQMFRFCQGYGKPMSGHHGNSLYIFQGSCQGCQPNSGKIGFSLVFSSQFLKSSF